MIIDAIPYLKLFGGLVYLLMGGDLLVRSAIGLSQRSRISPTLAGLTIVAAGTSAPELMVSMVAALSGSPGIALGNVIGSNIANVLLALGVPALIAPMACPDAGVRPQSVFMLGVTVLFVGLCFSGPLGWGDGLLLLGLLAIGIALSVRGHFAMPGVDPEEAREQLTAVLGIPGSARLIFLFGVLGTIMLPLGAELTVDGATHVALSLSVSDAVVGASMVALGTSLPEVSTTVIAAFHRSAGVAFGNVIGSNVFNILAIIGATALVTPIPVDAELLAYDVWIMLVAAVALTAFVLRDATLRRPAGIGMLIAYAGYIGSLYWPA
jgi:cation:H+ antiporter